MSRVIEMCKHIEMWEQQLKEELSNFVDRKDLEKYYFLNEALFYLHHIQEDNFKLSEDVKKEMDSIVNKYLSIIPKIAREKMKEVFEEFEY